MKQLFNLFLLLALSTPLIAANPQMDDDTWRKYAFNYVYKHEIWKDPLSGSLSGPGSSMQSTENVRTFLPAILKSLNVRTLLDAGCGDFHWLQNTALDLDHYYGVDIVPGLINNHNSAHANTKRSFYCKDVTKDALPKVDMIMCRDCLQHLSYADGINAIRNFKRSGATYLLTTSYYNMKRPAGDIKSGNFHLVNMQITPFHFPEPIMMFDEICAEPLMLQFRKRLCVWKIGDLPNYEG